jgi:hypothetical protein
MQACALCEKGTSQIPRSEFDRFFFRLGIICGSRTGMLDLQSHTIRCSLDQARIELGTCPAKPVIQVADDHFLETQRMQGMQKDHRITTAGYANKKFFALGKPPHGGFQSD